MTQPQPIAIVAGAERTFGAEIVETLKRQGYATISAHFSGQDLPELLSTLTKVDVLVVNAPVTLPNIAFDDISDTDFGEAMEDTLFGVVRLAQAVLPRMGRGGRIVNLGSKGQLGAWGGAHVMAASAALAAMTRSMALEFLKDGISVNHVAAGFVGSGWDTPAARQEVARVTALLCAEATGLVGETLIVDGGQSLRMSESRSR